MSDEWPSMSNAGVLDRTAETMVSRGGRSGLGLDLVLRSAPPPSLIRGYPDAGLHHKVGFARVQDRGNWSSA